MQAARSNGGGGDGSRFSKDRAEILRLITQLTAKRVANTQQREAVRKPPTIPDPNPPERNGIPPSVRSLLQRLDARLSLIEAKLAEPGSGRRSSKPPPLAQDDTVQNATFSGVIQGQMLSDMLQLVSSNDLSGVFVVDSGGSKCHMYFELGRIFHAEAPGMTGDQAFFAAFGADTGRYYFTETDDLPSDRTIDAGTQFLILEALRRIDESRA